jgi:cytochrome P450
MTGAVTIFVLAMVLHPDIQRTAQEEIDRVVGPGSFPTIRDQANLPYLNALYKEVLRWHTTVPGGELIS